ncbi:ATP-binding protein [uncultured Alistipes sp.]|jgi:two-component system sensor histidine kinase|uniref:sensor histidine kinase n=1 Tax=uncultured Alistipes sp. TaxID=538949 RepID=UPI0025FA7F36|nr:ATP-binding protein [uncultured Alistipes sp.]
MKSKWIFWILALLVFGSLVVIGIVFFRDNLAVLYVIEGIALLAILLFIILYRQLIKPYQIILNGMELLKEQDFSSRLPAVHSAEANRLIAVFNRMMAQLKEERLHVREKNQFLDLLIEASPQGVVILDFDDGISAVNAAATKMLSISKAENVLGGRLSDIDNELARKLALLDTGDNVVVRTSWQGIYRCIRSSFMDRGFNHPFVLIEELTHELHKIEKQSYSNIIRMISHEVNNSIGAIGSTLGVVSEIVGDQTEGGPWADVIPAVDASYARCGNLARFVGNLADVVKIPEPAIAETSLNKLIHSVEALTSIECRRRNITLTLSLTEEDILIKADAIQFEQVLVNVVKNAYESIGSGGEIRITTTSAPTSVTVEDNGPGISPETAQNLFMPFFTTKPKGQGVGLMFVREVLTNHRFGFSLNTAGGWTRFRIDMQ